MRLPDGRQMQSKVCQDNGKALMSYSNRELGQWILRDVLGLREDELLTYKKLQTIGIDSVRIDKISNDQFEINFSAIGYMKNLRKILTYRIWTCFRKQKEAKSCLKLEAKTQNLKSLFRKALWKKALDIEKTAISILENQILF